MKPAVFLSVEGPVGQKIVPGMHVHFENCCESAHRRNTAGRPDRPGPATY